MSSPKQAFDAFLHALQTQDGVALENILSDSFRFTGTAAQHQTKRTRIEHVLVNPVFRSLRLRNIDFTALENTCLVFAEFQYEGHGDATLWFGRSTFVFVKQADDWKLVSQHNSHVAFPEV